MPEKFLTSLDGLFLYHQRLAAFKWLIHAFSLRRDPLNGKEMSLGFNGYQPREVVEGNRQKLIQSVCKKNMPLITLRQVHSDIVFTVRSPLLVETAEEGDSLITNEADFLIAVQTADCLPVLLVDPDKRAVASVHAGWRGILRQIVQKTLTLMQRQYSTNPWDCVAVIGPSIRECCYEVGEDVIEAFVREFDYAPDLFHRSQLGSEKAQKRFLDLPAACRRQLLDGGLDAENVFTNAPCTTCNINRLFSHRGESGKTGRMMAVIGITGETPQSSR